ncbi:MAG: hypothetical protein MI974_21520 [Chitinophagales bacterium]|nr:hypothetical protein [Chitinophagales bacterium]
MDMYTRLSKINYYLISVICLITCFSLGCSPKSTFLVRKNDFQPKAWRQILAQIGIDCPNEELENYCSGEFLKLEILDLYPGNSNYLLIQDVGNFFSGTAGISFWLLEESNDSFFLIQDFFGLELSISKEKNLVNEHKKLLLSYLGPNDAGMRQNRQGELIWANGQYNYHELLTINEEPYLVPISILKKINCSALCSTEVGKDALENCSKTFYLEYFTLQKIHDSQQGRFFFILKYQNVDYREFHSWLIEENNGTYEVIQTFFGKNISETKTSTNNRIDLIPEFDGVLRTEKFKEVKYIWNGKQYEVFPDTVLTGQLNYYEKS